MNNNNIFCFVGFKGEFPFVEKFLSFKKIFEVNSAVFSFSAKSPLLEEELERTIVAGKTTIVLNAGASTPFNFTAWAEKNNVRLLIFGQQGVKNEKELLCALLSIFPKIGRNGYKERGFQAPRFYICKLCKCKVTRGTGGVPPLFNLKKSSRQLKRN